ncbi:MAG TPA: hypothetical protein P5567_05460 [Kiritimatiellia bacterium]|nr:hypothetical protein [Kiritimatiellia bacterium]HRZ11885.1 hypothetical protein [Kiritimatiellia bacterium]HSA17309.1 hypothetical protein [Kiritimatiellia bacterium]
MERKWRSCHFSGDRNRHFRYEFCWISGLVKSRFHEEEFTSSPLSSWRVSSPLSSWLPLLSPPLHPRALPSRDWLTAGAAYAIPLTRVNPPRRASIFSANLSSAPPPHKGADSRQDLPFVLPILRDGDRSAADLSPTSSKKEQDAVNALHRLEK